MTFNNLEITIIAISIAIALGVAIGAIKIRNISIGVGGILFSGILVGHILTKENIILNHDILHFIKSFGMMLFVYAIGNRVGPSFISSLKSQGLKLNLLILLSISIATIITVLIAKCSGIEIQYILGMMSGAVTSTPSLGAGSEALRIAGVAPDKVSQIGLSYAVAYPFGILGLITVMLIVKAIFKINIQAEEREFEAENSRKTVPLAFKDIEVTNNFLNGYSVTEICDMVNQKVVISRVKHGDNTFVPKPDTTIEAGDIIRAIGNVKYVNKLARAIGIISQIDATMNATNLSYSRVIATNYKVLGKSIPELSLHKFTDVVISRITRNGIDFSPLRSLKLQFGDILHVIGEQENIDAVAVRFGNNSAQINKAQIVPIFIGLAVGMLIGAFPISIPGTSIPIKLGMAGGPLMAGIIFSRIGNIGPVVWHMPPSVNNAIKDMGVVLFLSIVGISSGAMFIDSIVNGDGLKWMLWGTLITLIPVMTIGFIGRKFLKLNYLTLIGMIAGGNTDTPALAYASSLSNSDAMSQGYATVYPFTMFLRILSPQIIVLLLMGQ